jgi:hypothetical protein
MLWRIGSISEADLRNEAANFFRGAVGREFWSCNGATWILRPDPIARRFLAVLDDEYARAEARVRQPLRWRRNRAFPRPPGTTGHS